MYSKLYKSFDVDQGNDESGAIFDTSSYWQKVHTISMLHPRRAWMQRILWSCHHYTTGTAAEGSLGDEPLAFWVLLRLHVCCFIVLPSRDFEWNSSSPSHHQIGSTALILCILKNSRLKLIHQHHHHHHARLRLSAPERWPTRRLEMLSLHPSSWSWNSVQNLQSLDLEHHFLPPPPASRTAQKNSHANLQLKTRTRIT